MCICLHNWNVNLHILVLFSFLLSSSPNPILGGIEAESKRNSSRLQKNGGLWFVLHGAETHAQLPWSTLGKNLERKDCVVPLDRLDFRLWAFQPWQRVLCKLGRNQQSCLNLRECKSSDSDGWWLVWTEDRRASSSWRDLGKFSGAFSQHWEAQWDEDLSSGLFWFRNKWSIGTFHINPSVWTKSHTSYLYICFGGTEGKSRQQ